MKINIQKIVAHSALVTLTGAQCWGASLQETKLIQQMKDRGMSEEQAGTLNAREKFQAMEQLERAQMQIEADQTTAREIEKKEQMHENMLKQEQDIFTPEQAHALEVAQKSKFDTISVSEIPQNIIKHFEFLKNFIEDFSEATEIPLPFGVTRANFLSLEQYAKILTQYETTHPQANQNALIQHLTEKLKELNHSEVQSLEELQAADYLNNAIIIAAIINQLNLVLAAQEGHIQTVLALIDRMPSINVSNQNLMEQALNAAASNGHTQTVLALIDRGTNINVSYQNLMEQALNTAAANGRTETVLTLIDRGTNINVSYQNLMEQALNAAASNGHTETVLTLIDRMPNINVRNQDLMKQLLMAAIANGRTETVLALIDRGANLYDRCPNNDTTLILAVSKHFKEIVQILIDAVKAADGDVQNFINIKTDSSELTAFILAAMIGDTEIAQILINEIKAAHGNTKAFIDTADRHGRTPLMWATMNQKEKMVDFLLAQGADINLVDSEGEGIMHFALNREMWAKLKPIYTQGKQEALNKDLFKAIHKNKWDETRKLIENGADYYNALNENGDTALLAAVKENKADMVMLLLDFEGVNPNASIDRNGEPALMIATKNNYRKIVEILLKDRMNPDYKANPNYTDQNHWTPLMMAANNNELEIVEALLQAGARPDNETKGDNGETALMLAANNGSKEIVSALLIAGADVTHIDLNGNTAFDYASANGFTDIADIIAFVRDNEARNVTAQ